MVLVLELVLEGEEEEISINLTLQLSLTETETGPNNHTSQMDSLITRRVSSSYLIEPEFYSCHIPQIVKKFQNNHELKELLRKGQTNEFLNIYLN